MDARLLFPNEYLAAADILSLGGKDMTLTISAFKVEELKKTNKETATRGVVYFREMEDRHARDRTKVNKRFVLSAKCNMRSIGKALGTFETNDWIGRKITLYPDRCLAFGDMVDCIRIREKSAAAAPAQTEPAPVNDAVEDWKIAIEQADGRAALDQIVVDMAADKRLGIRDRAALGNIAAERAEAVLA